MKNDYASIKDFYDANPARRMSGESDYGVNWRADGKTWPNWRVTYVQTTGEIIAVCLGPKEGPVRILGVVPADPVSTPRRWDESYYRTLDRILDGYADPDVSGHDLAWVESKLAAYQSARVV